MIRALTILAAIVGARRLGSARRLGGYVEEAAVADIPRPTPADQCQPSQPAEGSAQAAAGLA